MDNERIAQMHSMLRERVSRFFSKRSRYGVLLDQILTRIDEPGWSAVLFGGVIRDLMVFGPAFHPRDIDIVIDGADSTNIASIFGSFIRRRTRFGGFQMCIDGCAIDIWPLAETWALRHDHSFATSFRDLPKTTFLDVEAIAVDISCVRGRERRVYAEGFFEALSRRTIDINWQENPFPALAIVRSLITAAKLGFWIGPKLGAYLLVHTREIPLSDLVATQLAHYGRVFCTEETLSRWIQAAEEQSRRSPALTIRLPLPEQIPLQLWTDCSVLDG